MKTIIKQFKMTSDFIANLTASIDNISKSFSSNVALKKIIDACCKLTKADSGCILLLHDGKYRTQVRCSGFAAKDPYIRCCDRKDLAKHIDNIVKKRNVFVQNIADTPEWDLPTDMKYFVWAPLYDSKNNPFGVLKLNFKTGRKWFKNTDHFLVMGLGILSNHAAHIMEARKIAEENKRRAEILEKLSEISDLFMQHCHSIDELLPIVVEEVTKLINAEVCAVFLKEPKKTNSDFNYLRFKTGYSLKNEYIPLSSFQDMNFIKSLLSNQIIKIDKSYPKHFFFNQAIKNKKILIEYLNKAGIKDSKKVLKIFKPGKDLLDADLIPDEMKNRLIPVSIGGDAPTLTGAVAYKKMMKNIFGADNIKQDNDWGQAKNISYQYFPKGEWYSLLAYPLYIKEDIDALGVIKVENKKDSDGNYIRFTAEDEQILSILSTKISIAIKIANLMLDLNKANNIKSSFLYSISHSLFSPIFPMINCIDLLKDDYENIQDNATYRILETQTNRFKKHVDNLLAISRIQLSQEGIIDKNYQKEVCNIKEVIEHVYVLFSHYITNNKIVIHYSNTLDCYTCFDKDCLSDVFVNLFVNSIRAINSRRRIKDIPKNSSDYQGNINVNIEKENSTNLITITDNGIGILPGDEEKIFEKFYSSNSENKDFTTGTMGIGLFVCREYIIDHGGKIYVLPQKFKRYGAAFRIELPSEGKQI